MSNKELYLKELKNTSKLDLLVIGQDPYPTGANGIAFCKNTFDELFHNNCCGKDVLYSLGFSQIYIKENYSDPITFFLELLKKGIGFINVSHSINDKTERQLLEDKKYNLQFVKSAKQKVLLGKGSAYQLFSKHYPEIKLDDVLIHPSGWNKSQRFSEWELIWGKNYLEKYIIKLKSAKMEARFFLAEACYNTWRKIYVLTSDGVLHSKYLSYYNKTVDEKSFSFESFSEEDYSFGGYQTLREISKSEAISLQLRSQPNWVMEYLKNKGVQ